MRLPPIVLPATCSLVLILALTHMPGLFALGIRGYQKQIAPALGIHCGYAQIMHAESCSAFTRRTLLEKGMLRGLPDALHRFHQCHALAQRNAL